MSTTTVPDILDLCQEFVALPPGTTVKFVRGVDFWSAPGTFRNRLHREMRNEGWIIRSVTKDGDIYAETVRPLHP